MKKNNKNIFINMIGNFIAFSATGIVIVFLSDGKMPLAMVVAVMIILSRELP